MISYFDLLSLVEKGLEPKAISVKLDGRNEVKYVAEYDRDTFSHYRIEDVHDEDEGYRFYLAECFLESSMFEEDIKVLDAEENVLPELVPNELLDSMKDPIMEHVARKVNKIISYLEKKEE